MTVAVLEAATPTAACTESFPQLAPTISKCRSPSGIGCHRSGLVVGPGHCELNHCTRNRDTRKVRLDSLQCLRGPDEIRPAADGVSVKVVPKPAGFTTIVTLLLACDCVLLAVSCRT